MPCCFSYLLSLPLNSRQHSGQDQQSHMVSQNTINRKKRYCRYREPYLLCPSPCRGRRFPLTNMDIEEAHIAQTAENRFGKEHRTVEAHHIGIAGHRTAVAAEHHTVAAAEHRTAAAVERRTAAAAECRTAAAVPRTAERPALAFVQENH